MASPSFPDAVIDGGLDYLLNNATAVSICTADPLGVYGSIAGSEVAKYIGLTSGSFVKADGTTGRKVTLSALSGNNGSATGAGSFLVFHDNAAIWLGTINGDGDTVNSGSAANINTTDVWEIGDPV